MIKRGKVSTESDELKLCRSKHNCLRRTKLKNNTGKWCLSFANHLYTARFQQERIPVGQRILACCGFVIPRTEICHPDSSPSSFCPSVFIQRDILSQRREEVAQVQPQLTIWIGLGCCCCLHACEA